MKTNQGREDGFSPILSNNQQTDKKFKYREDEVNEEVMAHIASTYGQHYVGKGVQIQDLMIANGRAEDFYVGSVLKYAARYGKKKGKNPEDILKAIHYLYLLYSLNHLDEEEI